MVGTGDERTFAEVGEGIIALEPIFEASEAQGAVWYIVEQDRCARPVLESAAHRESTISRAGARLSLHQHRSSTADKGIQHGHQVMTHKIIPEHLVSGEMSAGAEIGLRIDQTLTQDATGTMAYLQFEALELAGSSAELSVSYVDHNMLQADFRNADDHRYLQTRGRVRHLLLPARQRHLPPGAPGAFRRARQDPAGADSHTPTGGGLGMLAIGAGGLDVAVAMAGAPFYCPCPRWCGVWLTGELQPWVSAKDVILEVLRRLSRQGRRGQGDRVRRPRRGHPDRAPARHHHQHGRRAGRHHVDLSQRRARPARS